MTAGFLSSAHPLARSLYWLRAACLWGSFCILPLGAQEPVIRANVNLVLLDAAVLAKDGRPAVGLERKNFTLLDDGEPRTIASFDTGLADLSIALVLDYSRSMRTRRAAVLEASLQLVNRLTAADEVAVVAFNEKVRVHQAPTTARQLGWLETIKAVVPDGKTAVYEALAEAFRVLDAARNARRICILLSDGDDNASTISREAVMGKLRAGNITVFSIGLFSAGDPDADAGFLKSLAAESGGQAYFDESPARLAGTFQAILSDLRSRYVLGFLAGDSLASRPQVRRIQLQARDASGTRLRVRARRGYVIDSQ